VFRPVLVLYLSSRVRLNLNFAFKCTDNFHLLNSTLSEVLEPHVCGGGRRSNCCFIARVIKVWNTQNTFKLSFPTSRIKEYCQS
jgi:hypothetical protein